MNCGEPRRYYQDLLDERIDPKWERFSWLTLRALVSSANDVIAKGAGALVNDRRQRWVAAQRSAGVLEEFPELVVKPQVGHEPSFVLIGDTGEADDSQYAVVKPLLSVAGDTDFMLIASDVVYPAGDVNEYVNAFYVPYAEYPRPIYAIPGNHDWYDGLEGFMFHFCGAEALPHIEVDPTSYSLRERFWRRVWRRAAAPERAFLHSYRSKRPPWADDPAARHQPGPYYALDLGRLLVVCIDTGVTGELDAEQGDWLRQISKRPKPKLLVTGKPLYVDNERHPGLIDDWVHPARGHDRWPPNPTTHQFVDEIVRDCRHGYIGAIGGDIHNYQRYEESTGPFSRFTYLVSGGGGAYLSETHRIHLEKPNDEAAGVLSARKTYPSPSESLDCYARTFVPEVWHGVVRLLTASAGALAAVILIALVSRGTLSYDQGVVWPALAAGGVLGVALLLRAIFGRKAWRWRIGFQKARWRMSYVVTFCAGALVLLAARIITDGHPWEAFDDWVAWGWTAAFVLVPLAVAVGVAMYARSDGDDVPSGVTALWLVVGLLAAACSLSFVGREAGWDIAAKTLAVIGVLGSIGGVVWFDGRLGRFGYPGPKDFEENAAFGWCRRRRHVLANHWWPRVIQRIRGPLLVGIAVPWVAALIFLWRWDDRAAIAAVVTLVAFAHVPILLGFAFYMRRVSRNGTFWLLLIYIGLLVGTGVLLYSLGAGWIVVFAAGLACLTAVAIALVTAVYAFWMRGFNILGCLDARNGVLKDGEAKAFLGWQAGEPGEALERRVRLIGRIVNPSTRKIRSPLHTLISEIFEPEAPRLHKSFLRVDVLPDRVRIRCYGVTGAQADDGTCVEPTLVDDLELPFPEVLDAGSDADDLVIVVF